MTQITDLAAAGTLTGDEPAILSQLSATVTIAATTISALASDNSFNDSGTGFVTAGFAVNDRVTVAGFTGDTANNIFVGTITVLTAGKMTIGGTDGDVIVDDAAGESVTITKWVSVRTTTQDIADLGGGGVPSGSSFPGSPTTGDQFYRTDRNLQYFYNGTNWLTTQLFTLTLNPTDELLPATVTSATFRSRSPVYLGDLYGVYWENLTSYYQFVGTGNWTVAISDVIGSITTYSGISSDTSGTTTALGITRSTGAGYVYWTATENSGTASFYFNATIGYRLVG